MNANAIALDALKPCPFCGAGATEITPNGRQWTGSGWGEPSSVSVRHWCDAVPGQPSRMLERVGRDEASAIAAWNRRAAIAALEAEPQGWSPMETAPKDRYITVQQHAVYRWLPYRQGSEQLRKGITGRWQRYVGYGFENAELSGYGWRNAELAATPPKD